MKKLVIFLSFFLILAVPALARNATPSAKREEARIQIAEHINQQLEKIQNQAVKHFNNVLEKMSQLLAKIKTRVPATDITAAQAAITAAQTAVADLTDNVYTIEFTAESGLRVGASAAKTKLRSDIKAVHEKVRLARQAVVNTLQEAKKI